MAYNLELAERIEEVLAGRPGYAARRMFGGVGYLRAGNMAVGVLGDELIVRVGPADWSAALTEEHVREFDITGRSMTGWVMVARHGWTAPDQLTAWLERGWTFAGGLPPKGE